MSSFPAATFPDDRHVPLAVNSVIVISVGILCCAVLHCAGAVLWFS